MQIFVRVKDVNFIATCKRLQLLITFQDKGLIFLFLISARKFCQTENSNGGKSIISR